MSHAPLNRHFSAPQFSAPFRQPVEAHRDRSPSAFESAADQDSADQASAAPSRTTNMPRNIAMFRDAAVGVGALMTGGGMIALAVEVSRYLGRISGNVAGAAGSVASVAQSVDGVATVAESALQNVTADVGQISGNLSSGLGGLLKGLGGL